MLSAQILSRDPKLIPASFEIIRTPPQHVYDDLFKQMEQHGGLPLIAGDYGAFLRGLGEDNFAFFAFRDRSRSTFGLNTPRPLICYRCRSLHRFRYLVDVRRR